MITPLIIGISGKMQSGKTTTANILKNIFLKQGYHVILDSFAAPIKEMCLENGWLTKEHLKDKNKFCSLQWKNMPGYTYYYNTVRNGPDPEQFMTSRELLQYLGTDIFRHIDKNFWIKLAFKKAQDSIIEDGVEIIIYDDVRFINECEAIKQKNGFLIYLMRSLILDSHSSETELDPFNYNNFHVIIDNSNWSLEELEQSIKNLAYKIGE